LLRLPRWAKNPTELARSVDWATARKPLTSAGGSREVAAEPVPSPPPIARLERGVCQDALRLPGAWCHSVPGPRFDFASASICFHPVVALAARGLHACPGQFARAPPDTSRHPSGPYNPGLRYGFPECSAPNPDWFPPALYGGHPPPAAARNQSADSTAA